MIMNNIPFTPSSCPIQVGMTIWVPETNSEQLVLERFFNGTNADDPLLRTVTEVFTGNNLLNRRIAYYDRLGKELQLLPAYTIEEVPNSHNKIRECALKINDDVDLCAETFTDSESDEKQVRVYNTLDNKEYIVATLQYPCSSCSDYNSVVLINKSTKDILCIINDTKWLHYMLGDDGYSTVDTSDEAIDYVHNILSDIAKYWR